MRFVYNDGGRSKYFKAENVGDCVCRAISIATGRDYKQTYDDLHDLAKEEKPSKRKKRKSSPRNGMYKDTYKILIEDILGWRWVSCMGIGTGCSTHMDKDELPHGTIIVRLSKHLACVKDGVLYDTYDCTRGGKRCVYGYWYDPTDQYFGGCT